MAFKLIDEESGMYVCPYCDGRILRIGNYAECCECGEEFRRQRS